MMSAMVPLLLLTMALTAHGQVLYSGAEKVGRFVGKDGPDFWTVDAQGRPKVRLFKAGKDTGIITDGGMTKIIQRHRKDVQAGETPLPNPVLQMNKSNCTKIDLAPKMGPVRRQVGQSCAAYTAMELLNFGLTERYSVLHLALSAGTKNEERPFTPLSGISGLDGGTPDAYLKASMASGLCPESLIPSSASEVESDYKKLMRYYKEVKETKGRLDEVCEQEIQKADKDPEKIVAVLRNFEHKKEDLWKDKAIRGELARLYPGIDPKVINDIYDRSTDKDSFLKGLMEFNCKEHLVKDIPLGKKPEDVTTSSVWAHTLDEYFEEDRPPLLDKINRALERARPSAIGFFSGGFILENGGGEHGHHAAAVAGRGWLPEERDRHGEVTREAGCYYLIKNSWGPDWKVGEGLKARSSKEHPGYFVASEKQLMEHLHDVSTID